MYLEIYLYQGKFNHIEISIPPAANFQIIRLKFEAQNKWTKHWEYENFEGNQLWSTRKIFSEKSDGIFFLLVQNFVLAIFKEKKNLIIIK